MSEEWVKTVTLAFHTTYEQLAPLYGYETRKDTKEFDFNAPNGQLMKETVRKIITPFFMASKELERQRDKYKSVIDEIKGIVEETNYLANKTEIVNRGNIELHGVIDRLCLILRKIEILDKAKENVNETDNN